MIAPHFTDKEIEALGAGLDPKDVSAARVVIFWTRGVAWESHTHPNGRKCGSRIMLLCYPWRYDHIACKWEPEAPKSMEDPEGGKVGHAVEHYDPTEFFYCIDCKRVGIHRSREHYELTGALCEIIPTNGRCRTHGYHHRECNRHDLGTDCVRCGKEMFKTEAIMFLAHQDIYVHEACVREGDQ